MQERQINVETIEQKQAMIGAWINDISEKQEVKEIPANDLKEVLQSYGASFENLNEIDKRNLSMYAEKKRVGALEAVWGQKFNDYKNWVQEYIGDYEKRTGKELPKMKNVTSLKNTERVASGRKDSGMIHFLGDLTGYASGNLGFDGFKLLLQTRAENGAIRELPKEKREGKETQYIEWDREIDEEKGALTVDPRFHPKTEELIPVDKQVVRPASFPPEFPTKAFDWLKK